MGFIRKPRCEKPRARIRCILDTKDYSEQATYQNYLRLVEAPRLKSHVVESFGAVLLHASAPRVEVGVLEGVLPALQGREGEQVSCERDRRRLCVCAFTPLLALLALEKRTSTPEPPCWARLLRARHATQAFRKKKSSKEKQKIAVTVLPRARQGSPNPHSRS